MQLIHGDCLEEMKNIPDGSIDMILCDLPYGTTACSWDTIIPFAPPGEAYKRIIKDNGAIVLTASQPFTSKLVMSNLDMFKYCWVWEKNRGSNFAVMKYQPMKEHEDLLIFSKGVTIYKPIMQIRKGGGLERSKYKYNPSNTGKRQHMGGIVTKHAEHNGTNKERYPSSIQKFNTETGLHPTQKPVPLFEYLIKTYTNEGDLVLDNCAGSGTTGMACIRTNRNYILIEKERKYVDIINNRIKEELSQGDMFRDPNINSYDSVFEAVLAGKE